MIGSKERITRCTAMSRYGYRERKRATKNTVCRERIWSERREKGLDLDVGSFYAVPIAFGSGFGIGSGYTYQLKKR